MALWALRLLVVNGPPAVGKSTMARRYAEAHPMTLLIDVDEIRELISAWREAPHEAGLRARELVLTMTRNHLQAGHDVVVAQLYGWPDDLDRLEAMAKETQSGFDEIVLMADVESTIERFRARGGRRLGDALASDDGLNSIARLHGRVVELLGVRPNATVITPVWGDPNATYELIAAGLAEPVAD